MITPPSAKKPMPVLMWFHGAGGNAEHCGGGGANSLAGLAEKNGFALVCGNAIEGQWQIPEVFNDTTGPKCTKDYSEIRYLADIMGELEQHKDTYDTSRIFTSGCSMGSAFSIYSSQCLQTMYPNAITAFATHSTGFKEKGDGNKLPPDNYNKKYTWGECPNGCKYWPTSLPKKSSMKACIFDNAQDPNANDPTFYHTSVQLNKVWTAAGNKAETHFGQGGHCQIHSFAAIVDCLDDGTHRLVPAELPTPAPPAPSPAPGPGPAPSPGPSGKCQSQPPAACIAACSKHCPDLRSKGGSCDKCMGPLEPSKDLMQACAKWGDFHELVTCFCDTPSSNNATRVAQTPTTTTPATTTVAPTTTTAAPTTTTPTFTQTVYDLGDDVCAKTGHKTATKIALSTSTSQHCVEVHNWGKVIATCKSGVLTYTLFDNDSCTGHSTGTRSWALDECVQGYGVSWAYSDCEETSETTPAAPPTRTDTSVFSEWA
jgi:hypothetical protein